MPWMIVPFPFTEHKGVRIYWTWGEGGRACHRYRFSTSIDIEDERFHFDVRDLPLAGARRLARRAAEGAPDETAVLTILHEAIDRGLLREHAVPPRGHRH